MFPTPYHLQKPLDRAHITKQTSLIETPCRYYGSMSGCSHGTKCVFSHCYPESIKICKFQNNCHFGKKCKFRHWTNEVRPECESKFQVLIHGFMYDISDDYNCPLEIIKICIAYSNTFIPGLLRYHPNNTHKLTLIKEALVPRCDNILGVIHNNYYLDRWKFVQRILNRQDLDPIELIDDDKKLKQTVRDEYAQVLAEQLKEINIKARLCYGRF